MKNRSLKDKNIFTIITKRNLYLITISLNYILIAVNKL